MDEVLAPAERTLPAMLRQAAERFGERPLLEIPGGAWKHRDAMDAVARRAGALHAAGIGRGDRVALMCSNRIEQLEVFLACGWLGAIAVPINTAAMGPQIDYYLGNSGAKLLVLEDAFLPRLQTAVKTWLPGQMPDGDAVEAAAVGPGDTLAILYTSGTTGPAKGVTCPHAQYYWWGVNTADILAVRADDVLCTTLPLFHINALNTFAQALLTGCRVAYEPRFSVSEFWRAMGARRATVTYLLGAMVPMLLSRMQGDEKDHSVRIALAPGVPPPAKEAFRTRTGIAIADGYGSTETNFVIAAQPDSPRNDVMGWVRPGFEAQVAGDGELLLRSHDRLCFASGYFGMPDETAKAWRDGWFHTGDRVVRDADGAFRFVDRIKEAIRRRGENISSWEVEQVLLLHPLVAGAAVYPVASELGEDEVMAALVLKERADPAAICAWCEARLPRFAIPRFIDVVDELPRTENGKVQKFKLRERGVGASTWDRQKP